MLIDILFKSGFTSVRGFAYLNVPSNYGEKKVNIYQFNLDPGSPLLNLTTSLIVCDAENFLYLTSLKPNIYYFSTSVLSRYLYDGAYRQTSVNRMFVKPLT